MWSQCGHSVFKVCSQCSHSVVTVCSPCGQNRPMTKSHVVINCFHSDFTVCSQCVISMHLALCFNATYAVSLEIHIMMGLETLRGLKQVHTVLSPFSTVLKNMITQQLHCGDWVYFHKGYVSVLLGTTILIFINLFVRKFRLLWLELKYLNR